MTQNLPDDVYRFLLAHIDSVEQLEVLLLLYRTTDTEWTAEGVAQALYSQVPSVARRLDSLRAKGLLTYSSDRYRYNPATGEPHATVARLGDIYRERRVAVITVIASKPMENVRAFADVFRLLRKDEE